MPSSRTRGGRKDEGGYMVNEWEITIPSLTGGRTRRAYVYLPRGYYEEDRRYPVMYMFDGHNLFFDEEATFGKSWGIGEYLDYTNTKLIVAAVECNHEGNGRLEEYTPVNFRMPDGSFIRARGRRYMEWLTHEFKPYIDENYRTLPDRNNTAIGGSSMGGLMTLYALARYGMYFSKGAALSPSLWVGGELPQFIKEASFSRTTTLYMDYGSREFKNHAAQRGIFAEVSADLIKKGVFVTSRIVPGGTHTEASWQRQIPVFMAALGFEGE